MLCLLKKAPSFISTLLAVNVSYMKLMARKAKNMQEVMTSRWWWFFWKDETTPLRLEMSSELSMEADIMSESRCLIFLALTVRMVSGMRADCLRAGLS